MRSVWMTTGAVMTTQPEEAAWLDHAEGFPLQLSSKAHSGRFGVLLQIEVGLYGLKHESSKVFVQKVDGRLLALDVDLIACGF